MQYCFNVLGKSLLRLHNLITQRIKRLGGGVAGCCGGCRLLWGGWGRGEEEIWRGLEKKKELKRNFEGTTYLRLPTTNFATR